jgi:hypothetical protein
MFQQPRPEGDQRKVGSRKALKVLEKHTQALLQVMSELIRILNNYCRKKLYGNLEPIYTT